MERLAQQFPAGLRNRRPVAAQDGPGGMNIRKLPQRLLDLDNQRRRPPRARGRKARDDRRRDRCLERDRRPRRSHVAQPLRALQSQTIRGPASCSDPGRIRSRRRRNCELGPQVHYHQAINPKQRGPPNRFRSREQRCSCGGLRFKVEVRRPELEVVAQY